MRRRPVDPLVPCLDRVNDTAEATGRVSSRSRVRDPTSALTRGSPPRVSVMIPSNEEGPDPVDPVQKVLSQTLDKSLRDPSTRYSRFSPFRERTGRQLGCPNLRDLGLVPPTRPLDSSKGGVLIVHPSLVLVLPQTTEDPSRQVLSSAPPGERRRDRSHQGRRFTPPTRPTKSPRGGGRDGKG